MKNNLGVRTKYRLGSRSWDFLGSLTCPQSTASNLLEKMIWTLSQCLPHLLTQSRCPCLIGALQTTSFLRFPHYISSQMGLRNLLTWWFLRFLFLLCVEMMLCPAFSVLKEARSPISHCWVIFVYCDYRPFIRYGFWKYLLGVDGLLFHSLTIIFDTVKTFHYHLKPTSVFKKCDSGSVSKQC